MIGSELCYHCLHHFMKFMITIYYEVQALFQVKMYHLIKSYNGDATMHHRHRQNGLYHFFVRKKNVVYYNKIMQLQKLGWAQPVQCILIYVAVETGGWRVWLPYPRSTPMLEMQGNIFSPSVETEKITKKKKHVAQQFFNMT